MSGKIGLLVASWGLGGSGVWVFVSEVADVCSIAGFVGDAPLSLKDWKPTKAPTPIMARPIIVIIIKRTFIVFDF